MQLFSIHESLGNDSQSYQLLLARPSTLVEVITQTHYFRAIA